VRANIRRARVCCAFIIIVAMACFKASYALSIPSIAVGSGGRTIGIGCAAACCYFNALHHYILVNTNVSRTSCKRQVISARSCSAVDCDSNIKIVVGINRDIKCSRVIHSETSIACRRGAHRNNICTIKYTAPRIYARSTRRIGCLFIFKINN
jgi:hypothetical protein